jgi:AcrR family transcriptional regulator
MENSDIIKKYIVYTLDKGERPANEHIFAKYLKISEAKFYTFYPSLCALEQDLWENTITTTLARLRADSNYTNYSSREQLLSFYYTYIEELNEYRSFYKELLRADINLLKNVPARFKKIKTHYVAFANEILTEAKSKGEIKARPLIDSKYADLLFLQFLFVLRYWYKDDSLGFEQTDAAIEKAVNLSFDLMNSNILDSVFDFAKFMIR